MKKSLVQLALKPFFGWFQIPENPISDSRSVTSPYALLDDDTFCIQFASIHETTSQAESNSRERELPKKPWELIHDWDVWAEIPSIFRLSFFFTKLLTKKCKECLPVWAVLLLKFWTWTYVQSLLKLCRRTNKTETCGFVWSFYNWIVKQYVSFF